MSDADVLQGRLQGALFDECAGWIWEQLQEEGVYLAGELVEEVLRVERRLGLQAEHSPASVAAIAAALAGTPVTPAHVEAVLGWEDEFLGLAAIPRAAS